MLTMSMKTLYRLQNTRKSGDTFLFPDYSWTCVLLSEHASTAPGIILTIVAIKHKVLAKIHKELIHT